MPLAIVGMGCRFGGGVTSPSRLWDLVLAGKDVWSEIPESRFKAKNFYHPDPTKVSAIHANGGYFISEDVGAFDVSFFNMSADAAAAMDPQLRLQLEVTFEALESAGIPLSKIAGSNTSFFTGSLGQDYKDIAGRDHLQVPRLFVMGNDYSMMANRVSHFFDLRGHSTSIDTACSTSLMGVHLACQSLRSGDSDAAIVGGSGLCLSPELFSGISTTGLCGPDGKCYAFDHRAQGYGRGEGIGALVIKRLSDAIRDGDPIRAVIRETGANQNGKTVSITSPDTEAQKRLIEQCYCNAGLDPLDTALVEAHGTGTLVGDPREANAIGTTLGQGRPAGKPLYMASVKTNIGHTEAASGLASIIKVVMSMENNRIAPSMNFERVNPDIDLKGLGLEIPTRPLAWPSSESAARRASVNNFGFGGTNTHVILEEAGPLSTLYGNNSNKAVRQTVNPSRKLFVLSARDKVAAAQMTLDFKEHLQDNARRYTDASAFDDLAYTLSERRTRFPWTVAVSAADASELATWLGDSLTKPVQNAGTPPRLGFIFNGQGAQWYGMGRELMSAYPVYNQTLQECDRVIASFGAKWSILDELGRDEASSRVNDVQFSMPLTCAVQLALVELLKDFGVQPAAVTGHSSGEVAAAFAAGALSLGEAMACTYFRGLINAVHIAAASGNSDTVEGGMMAVGLGPTELTSYLEDTRSGKVVIACVNSPSSVTLAGDMAGIQELETRFKNERIFARALRVQAAFHSHHMLPLQDQYLAALQKHVDTTRTTDARKALWEQVLFVSPVTGEPVEDASQLGPQHWVQNMIQPVLFSQALHRAVVDKAKQQQIDAIIEIGPHSALAGPIRQCLKSVSALKSLDVGYGSCLERGKDAVQTMQTLAGLLIGKCHPVDTCRVNFPRAAQGLRVATGLPSYAWNHKQVFWHEAKMSLEHTGRENPPHDLLGVRSPGTSDKAPIWRHMIRTGEIPWVRDHVVQGDILYPAAGFIAMAIEAMRQMHSPEDRPISGYRLSDMDILKAVVVPENTEGVEVQLFLEPVSERSLEHGKRRFRVYSPSRTGQGWDEAVRGFVAVETDGEPSSLFSVQPSKYPHHMDPEDVYTSLNEIGVSHGPVFQKLDEIHTGQDCSSATFRVANTTDLMPYNFQQSHVIHPITLDQVFQAAYTTLSTEARRKVGAAVPRSIKALYISAKTATDPGSSMSALSQLLQYNRQGFHVGSTVFSASRSEGQPSTPVIQVDGMRYQSINNTSSQDEAGDTTWDICAFLDYETSFSLNDPSILVNRLKRSADDDEKATSRDLDRATYHLMADAVSQLSESDIADLEWHHKLLFKWMRLQLQRAAADEMAPRSSRWAKASSGVKTMFLDRVADSGPEGAMLVRVGRRLVEILRNEVAPLEVMLEGDLLFRVYSETRYFRRCTEQLAEVVAAFARERPRARILEIGGGTGGGTEPVLQALGPSGFSHYDFTDISSGFFQRARERFSAWGDKISYTALNIEDDVVAQGFSENSYDLIIAVQVLHATKNMEKTMTNVRKLLKDGGRLVLIETTQDWASLQLIFGITPGWWLSEEPERALSPNMPLASWQRVLQATGFSGIDVNVWDSDEEQHQGLSLMVSTAVQQHASVYSDKVALVYDCAGHDATDVPPIEWLESLAAKIAAITGAAPTVGKLGEVDCSNKVVVIVSSLSRRDSGVSPGTTLNFAAVKPLLTQSKGVMWITSGATIECPSPEHAQALGMLRTYRAEDTVHRFVSLDLDPARRNWDETSQDVITRIFSTAFDTSKSDLIGDVEFAERGGTILLPRVRRDEAETATFANHDPEPELQPFIQPAQENRQLRMDVAVPGRLDSIVFRDDEEMGKPLFEGWVEVEARAFGLTVRDDDGEAGHAGLEPAGTVTCVGTGVDKVKEGDRVVALSLHADGGRIASRVRVPWTSVVPIPQGLSFSDAASAALAFATAFYSLFEVGRLERGETVLIHEAAESVGQACISLAQWSGVKILTTVGTSEQRSFLGENYGIPDEAIFSSRDASFVPTVLAATSQRGVDAVINSLTGPLLQKSCCLVAPYGRFVEMGKSDINRGMSLQMDMFSKGASFTSVDLTQLADHRGLVLRRVLEKVLGLLARNAVHYAGPVTSHSMSQIAVALQAMQTANAGEKHIIVPESTGDLVKVVQQRRPARLSEDATYLITGGLGGLGRSLARWFVDHGAKNLVLLSRNATSSPHAQPLRDHLGDGVRLELANCDVANLADLRRVLEECARKGLPPVRGIVHGAAVFSDSILERMLDVQWQTALGPKVDGTWNLHTIFSAAGSLDFFIILSSCVGMAGNPSQANYTAGGAFQDAVARNRAAQGLPCVTIDLGLVTDLGYLADAGKDQLSKQLETTEQFRVIRETDLHRLVDYGVREPLRPIRTSQVVTGLAGSAVRKQRIPWTRELRFAALAADDDRNQNGSSKQEQDGASATVNLAQALAGAQDAEEAAELVEKAVIAKLSDMFARPVEDIDATQPLSKYGVDSLVAVEFRNWLVFTTRCDMSIFDLLGAKSLRDLAGTVGKRNKATSGPA
ncbi:hypothetical protein QBC37DRAFT_350610 [Rhypophila decipiens]|uniref:Polyketide synthase n=1 Tax=Rhypophila decipiens TaxID=261697 RepID=A0AAN6Y4Q5_9PEZI|nr:hypothetical protein QBC37DRAFT_350610 [Rhypophila decipiens]